MKKLTIVLLACLLCGGCEFLTGAGTVVALSETAARLEAEANAYVASMEAEVAVMREAGDSAEKIIRHETLIAEGKEVAARLMLVRQGLSTDWKDPVAVGGYGAAVILAATSWLLKRKAAMSQKKYEAHKIGVNRIVLAHPDIAAETYDTIGEERVNLGL